MPVLPPEDVKAIEESKGQISDNDKWVWPINSTSLTSQNGVNGHKGIDLATNQKTGLPVVAPTGGTIIKASNDLWNDGYGKMVVLKTNDGKTIYLGHFDNVTAVPGSVVKPGELLGYSGNTGNSTGPHLHYEIRTPGGGGYLDPLAFYGGVVGKFLQTYIAPKNVSASEPDPYVNDPNYERVTDQTYAGYKIYKNKTTGKIVTSKVDMSLPSASDVLGLPDLSSIPWESVLTGLLGVVLVVLGIVGLVGREAVTGALRPLTQAIKGLGE